MSDTEHTLYNILLIGGFIAAPITFLILLRIPAPYGRHVREGWGPEMPRRWGWVVMELPAAIVLPLCVFLSQPEASAPVWIFIAAWELHYLHRSLIFPFRLRDKRKRNPILVVLMAIGFNVINGYLNGRYLGLKAGDYTQAWFADPRFVIGALLFVAGFAINWHADHMLLRLRRETETGYKIPRGGLYRRVSCPNYFGEIVEWTGWALMVWSWPGLLFAVWTAANLIPRARTHHAWYRAHFTDYPPDRKAVVPFLY